MKLLIKMNTTSIIVETNQCLKWCTIMTSMMYGRWPMTYESKSLATVIVWIQLFLIRFGIDMLAFKSNSQKEDGIQLKLKQKCCEQVVNHRKTHRWNVKSYLNHVESSLWINSKQTWLNRLHNSV